MYIIKCAWCGKIIGFKFGFGFGVTHGICKPCKITYEAERKNIFTRLLKRR